MNFIPNAGDHFWVSIRPRERILMTIGGDDNVVKKQDRSYRDQVFKCEARDDTSLVAKCLIGGFLGRDKPHIFRHSDVTYSPVGPEVLVHLGLVASDAEAACK